MANRYAVANGNWSNTATWDGGTLPGVGDDVRPNGFAVTVDQNIDVVSLRNTAFAPAVAGGTFNFNTSAVTANISGNIVMDTAATSFIQVTATTGLVTINIPNGAIAGMTLANSTMISYSGNCNLTFTCISFVGGAVSSASNVTFLSKTSTGVFIFNGNITGRAASNPGVGPSMILSTASTNTINGNITGGGGASGTTGSQAVSISAGNLTINGNLIGGINSGGNGFALAATTNGTISIVGSITGGSTSVAISQTVGTMNITGNIVGGSGNNAISTGGILNITGNVTGVATAINSSGTITITGTITGGTSNGQVGINVLAGTLNHIGTVQASAFGSGVYCAAPTTSTVTCTGPFLRNGYTVAVASQTLSINSAYNPYFEFRKSDGTLVTYVDQSTSNFPVITNVRSGISYASGLYTGTLIMAVPSNVNLGVATDATVGTAEITAAAFLTTLSVSSDPLAVRLRNVSTVASTGGQIANYNI